MFEKQTDVHKYRILLFYIKFECKNISEQYLQRPKNQRGAIL